MVDGTSVLVDAGPDLRQQALTHDIRRLDAILFTHGHADHILGLDETRRFTGVQGRPMPCYGDEATLLDIRRMFAYVFDPATPRGGGSAPPAPWWSAPSATGGSTWPWGTSRPS